jgi:hypothetical protein
VPLTQINTAAAPPPSIRAFCPWCAPMTPHAKPELLAPPAP